LAVVAAAAVELELCILVASGTIVSSAALEAGTGSKLVDYDHTLQNKDSRTFFPQETFGRPGE
jgi:hypothetical protein